MLPRVTVRYARIAVPVPLGQAFTYALPVRGPAAQPGARALVELGTRSVIGVIVALEAEPPPGLAPDRIKTVRAVLDEAPALSPELLGFLLALARYYLAPVGEVLRLALPAIERGSAEARGQATFLEEAKAVQVGRIAQQVRATGTAAPELKGQALGILQDLTQGPVLTSELSRTWSNARAAIKRLEKLGLAVVESVSVTKDPFLDLRVQRDTPPTLTAAQQEAVGAVLRALEETPTSSPQQARAPRAFLLQGVTASGKTEVYLHAVARCLELGGGALVLVPEIALTPQLVSRFRARLGENIAVLHSALSESDRYAAWKRLRSGEVRVVVGARSALFAPVCDLKLVCVDEEHDGSFKQEEGVRYNARDMALLRAHRAGAVCVLGSATPSVMSEAAVRAGKLERLRLPERAHRAAVLPNVEIVDLRRVGPGPTGERLLSVMLHRELERVLAAGQQAILFLNRRGFSPSVLCDSCGELVVCPHCSVSLTLHRRGAERLRCHYCDYSRPVPSKCPACSSPKFAFEGAGTERIEAKLAEAFPQAKIGRLDRDVAAGAKSEKVLDRMRRGQIDVLVGTQMVTKGHDLPRVTLVGVLNADASLTLPDYRAAERTFHLLVQVAGRAGRGDEPGTVLIQTRQPEHPAIVLATRHDVDGFLEHEFADRQELNYPPFSRIALVKVDSMGEGLARGEAERLAGVARRAAARNVQILGPATAPLARLRNRWRFRFLVRGPDVAALRPPLLSVLRAGHDRRVRVAVDIDPVSML